MAPPQPASGSAPQLGELAVPGAGALTRLTALETVRARILLSIEHGLLAPGSKLPRTEAIAAGLEVGTITARRALEELVADGVLTRRRGRGGGTFVAADPPRIDDSAVIAYRTDSTTIQRLIDERSLMESAIMHAAALVATAAECDELDGYIAASAAAHDWLEHHLPDRAFHQRCAEISALPEVPRYLATYEHLHKYFVPYPQEQLEHGRDEHRTLVQAFRDRDPIAAVAVTRTHVDALRREMFIALTGK